MNIEENRKLYKSIQILFGVIFLVLITFGSYYLFTKDEIVTTKTQEKTNKSQVVNDDETEIIEEDDDNDGLTNKEEIEIFKSDPQEADTDGDGVIDGEEVKTLQNPLGLGELRKMEVMSIEDCENDGTCMFETAVNNKDEKICDLIPVEDEVIKDICLSEIAIVKKEKNICDNIKISEIRSDCEKRVKYILKGEDECETINNLTEKNICYYVIANSSNNYETCKKINEGEKEGVQRDFCISLIVKRLKYTKACAEIESFDFLKDCFLANDINGLNLEICGRYEGTEREECEEIVSLNTIEE